MVSIQTLSSSETLKVTVLGPGDSRAETPENRDVWWFLAQPFDPWVSPAEAEMLARALRGATDGTLHDYMFVGRLDDTVVGTAWHATNRATREMGVYGYVLTDPAHRGKGIAQILTKMSLEHFRADGGKAVYLGTDNPIARHVYEKLGYRSYNGIVMRAVREDVDPDIFDTDYFRYDGKGLVRDVTQGDVGGYVALLHAREPTDWVVRDFTESLFFAPPAVQATGCVGPFDRIWLRHEMNSANQLKALVTRDDRIVAAAALAGPASGALAGSAMLEFQCYPTYRGELETLLSATLEAAQSAGVRSVRGYAVAADRRAAFMEAGFSEESVARGLLDLGDKRADVHIFQRDLG
ncbi:MAG: GNAT family N-acetyltransferase [Chloroflexi bacterium]|nr:GNAT family N-acetyltransferase [Chloroflexota bacterium]MCY3939228.1 GNAT family N-acetyltransferase [Chloroflexota bacterium]